VKSFTALASILLFALSGAAAGSFKLLLNSLLDNQKPSPECHAETRIIPKNRLTKSFRRMLDNAVKQNTIVQAEMGYISMVRPH
jgi:hypothetical protein